MLAVSLPSEQRCLLSMGAGGAEERSPLFPCPRSHALWASPSTAHRFLLDVVVERQKYLWEGFKFYIIHVALK